MTTHRSATSLGNADDGVPARETSGDLPPALGGFDLTDLARFADGFPHEVFARLRREAPILYHPGGRTADGEGFWVLSTYADVTAAGSDIELFSSEGGGGRANGGTHIDDLPAGIYGGVMLPMMDDPRHAQFKDALRKAVTPDALAALAGRLREHADAIVGTAVKAGDCDAQHAIAREMSLTTIALLLGVPDADWPQFFSWTDVAMGYEDRDTGVVSDRSQQVLADMFNYGVELLAAKRAAPPADDLLSALAHATLADADRPLTDFERQANFNLLSLAGSEPPRGAMSIGLLALAEHPDQWAALRADRSLLDGAVEEILRWASPTPYNRRTVTRDTELRGTALRAGEKVTLWWASANRDETVFTDPFAFDVRRDPNPHVAFGMGGHTCLGERLGRLQMRIMLEALLDHAERIEPSAPARWARNNKHIVALSVPVTFTPAG